MNLSAELRPRPTLFQGLPLLHHRVRRAGIFGTGLASRNVLKIQVFNFRCSKYHVDNVTVIHI